MKRHFFWGGEERAGGFWCVILKLNHLKYRINEIVSSAIGITCVYLYSLFTCFCNSFVWISTQKYLNYNRTRTRITHKIILGQNISAFKQNSGAWSDQRAINCWWKGCYAAWESLQTKDFIIRISIFSLHFVIVIVMRFCMCDSNWQWRQLEFYWMLF